MRAIPPYDIICGLVWQLFFQKISIFSKESSSFLYKKIELIYKNRVVKLTLKGKNKISKQHFPGLLSRSSGHFIIQTRRA
jgi:hypothetical protein